MRVNSFGCLKEDPSHVGSDVQVPAKKVGTKYRWKQGDEEVVNRVEVLCGKTDRMIVVMMHFVETLIEWGAVH